MMLDGQPDIEVIAEAADGNEGVRLAQHLAPDVVLMDIRMPGLDGIAATRLLARPDAPRSPRVVILTAYDLDEYVFDALVAGASGFLMKDAPPEHLVQGVRQVAAGDGLLAPAVTRRLIEAFARRAAVSLGPFDDETQDMELTIRPLVAAIAGDEMMLSQMCGSVADDMLPKRNKMSRDCSICRSSISSASRASPRPPDESSAAASRTVGSAA